MRAVTVAREQPRTRVAMLIPRYHPIFGGAETQCRALVRHLSASGVAEVPFVLTRRLDERTPPLELVDGIPVHRLGPTGESRRATYAFYASALAALIRRRSEFDVLHCHATSVVGFIATLAGRVAKRPVLLKLSSNGELMSGLGNYTGEVRLDKSVRGRLRRPLARFMGRNASIIALNHQGREELALARAERVHTIANGIDLARFHPATASERENLRAQFGFAAGEIVFVYTGRFVAVKGIDLLIEAFRALSRRHGPPVRLCLVGSGELQQQSLSELIDRALRESDTLLTVLRPTADVVPILQAADAFVFPSRREGMPNSVLEAIAVGLPCVLSDIQPHRELAAHNPDARCWLFPSGNREALVAALADCTHALAAGLIPTPRLSAAFDIKSVAAQYGALYGSLARPAAR